MCYKINNFLYDVDDFCTSFLSSKCFANSLARVSFVTLSSFAHTVKL
jgi:hypothetical protein